MVRLAMVDPMGLATCDDVLQRAQQLRAAMVAFDDVQHEVEHLGRNQQRIDLLREDALSEVAGALVTGGGGHGQLAAVDQRREHLDSMIAQM